MTVKHSNEVATQTVAAGEMTTMQVLIGPNEGPNFAMRRFIMEPGGGMPRHTNQVEHEQYVLRGRGRIGIAEETFEVTAGDVVLIQGGVPHWYQSIGSEPFEFLCMVPNQPDKIEILGD